MNFKVFLMCFCLVELLLTFGFSQIIVANGSCTTLSNQIGRCIPIKQCASALERLKRKTDVDTDYVFRSKCGFDPASQYPKVCCDPPPRPPPPSIPPTLRPLVTPPPSAPGLGFREGEDLTTHRNAGKINARNCGNYNADKIAYGNTTEIFEYPFMALIAYKSSEGQSFKCAATLINDRYVLTAAHCVTGLDAGTKLAGIRLGEHNIRTQRDCRTYRDNLGRPQQMCAPPVQDIRIASFVVHPDYRGSSFGTPDIALIRLQKSADLTRENIRPICLPLGVRLRRREGIVAGWGSTERGDSSDVLLKARLDFITNTECVRTFSEITNRQLCARGINGTDACDGDSGGPLLSPEAVGDTVAWVQLGIIAAGTPFCALLSRPVVFTNVEGHLQWILDNID